MTQKHRTKHYIQIQITYSWKDKYVMAFKNLSDEFCMIINASFKAAKAVQLEF